MTRLLIPCTVYHTIETGNTDFEEIEDTFWSSDPEQQEYVVLRRFPDITYWRSVMDVVDPDGKYRPSGIVNYDTDSFEFIQVEQYCVQKWRVI